MSSTQNQTVQEQWRTFMLGVTPYEVSNLGRIRTGDDAKKVLKYTYPDNAHPKVRMKWRSVPGGLRFQSVLSVSKIVAENWLLPSQFTRIAHKDGDFSNCAADNLVYVDFARAYTDAAEKRRAYKVKKRIEQIEMERSEIHEPGYMPAALYKGPEFRPRAVAQAPQITRLQTEYEKRNLPPLSQDLQLNAYGVALPVPFPVVPQKEDAEGPDDIEPSGLYFSQARAVERTYTYLATKTERTADEDAALKNLREVLDF